MITIRPARPVDAPFLWEMLTHASSMDSHDAEAIAAAQADAYLSEYVADFGRDGDIGVIAERDGRPIAAAWVRLGRPGHATKPGSDQVPELAIAVAPDARGAGVGTTLLAALFDRARSRHKSIVLSVREHNPAVHLYERFGFKKVREIENRAGTLSFEMRLDF